MDTLNIGVLAHVDAGKTSLCEALLFAGKSIKSLGRVDHKNSLLDMYAMERERGITIFSKQARIMLENLCINLIDTPGHMDFSAETERILSVIDYALIVVSAKEGIQSHTKVLWELLGRYDIPTIVFVNKMDYTGIDKMAVLGFLQGINDNIVDFTQYNLDKGNMSFFDELSYCDEKLMEEYIETGGISPGSIKDAISKRLVFPCFFGSALKFEGIRQLLEFMEEYCLIKVYGDKFGLKVYKISRDSANIKLCHVKVTGASLRAKMPVGTEKVNEIRLYSGDKYETVAEVKSGGICAVTGLNNLQTGDLVIAEDIIKNRLFSKPVLSYEMTYPQDIDKNSFFKWLNELSESEPELDIRKEYSNNTISLKLFGNIQMEILKNRIRELFGSRVLFSEGRVVYKETLENTVEGVGHYEPLKNYVEVHLLLEPIEPETGLVFDSKLSKDMISDNVQKHIISHLSQNKDIKGVLTGSGLTGIRISLVAVKSNMKHPEMGYYLQAVYRALRQGLMQAKCLLLEPFYNFTIEAPQESLGRILSDLQNMYAVFKYEFKSDIVEINGYAPVSCIQNYSEKLISFTKGNGKIFLNPRGYGICHNEEEVIDTYAYEPELDTDNPSGSIFCENGDSYYVPWDEVFSHMYIPLYLDELLKDSIKDKENEEIKTVKSTYNDMVLDDEELTEIFERTYGRIKRRTADRQQKRIISSNKEYVYKKIPEIKEYIIIDGYNLIFASKELGALADYNLGAAREKLKDMLVNYRGYVRADIILVFDAYKVEGNYTQINNYSNIYVVYTQEAETADHYIERTVHEMSDKYNVCVVTSDYTEQIIIRSKGCRLMSSREFIEDMERVSVEIRNELLAVSRSNRKNFIFDALPKDIMEKINEIRDTKK
ncbi:hypothetical protein HMPREF9333_00676 [Johnsonella ignava ATCC 51276]|uniref:Tr-type G domain-containing protein n=1 Tax=Johnsonella ignava ATCC 51276 TaxID=679200 RepID=G5GGI6_9FIRM|nr:TetM/TetW/TetO/TetS family tetracycline resistance ribosomal protection protein [Johnsonella ignava]EHI56146.1 hypothetical protein HMPREF9333_00676 [Johnsonella ignava ATCC 51276]